MDLFAHGDGLHAAFAVVLWSGVEWSGVGWGVNREGYAFFKIKNALLLNWNYCGWQIAIAEKTVMKNKFTIHLLLGNFYNFTPKLFLVNDGILWKKQQTLK